jgi:hypothetical protein
MAEIRLNKHSELGDNEYNRKAKTEAPEMSSRRQRKLDKQQAQESDNSAQSSQL